MIGGIYLIFLKDDMNSWSNCEVYVPTYIFDANVKCGPTITYIASLDNITLIIRKIIQDFPNLFLYQRLVVISIYDVVEYL